MIARAEGKFIRLSPRKASQVAELIRGKDVLVAQSILRVIGKRPKEYMVKLLKSAIANAKVKGFNPSQLYVSAAVANPGPAWKRFKAAAFGRPSPIRKRTTHLRIELELKAGA